MHPTHVVLGLSFLFAPLHALAAQQRSAPAPLGRPPARIDIVPRADHHQHVIGPGAVAFLTPTSFVPAVTLPPELERVLRHRERASGGADVSLFSQDAHILDISDAEDHWVFGAEGVRRMIGAYEPGTPLVPTAWRMDGRVAFIAGVVGDRAPAKPSMHFMLGLEKDTLGTWRIAVEYATVKPPLEFPEPLTADRTIQVLDDAGVSRAAVISVAYWFGDGAFRGTAQEEYTAVRAENDWMHGQVSRFPRRLTGFCGVNPLRDYAVDEIRRCAKLPGVKGMKVHFGNSGVNVLNPAHVTLLRRFFRTANEHRMPVIAHLWTQDRSYGPQHTRIFVDEVLPEASDVPVQIAHLGGAGRYAYDSVTTVFIEAIASRKRGAKNLWFDMATVVTDRQSGETLALIAKRLRQLGLGRILWGADTPAGTRPDPILAWATFRRQLPLTDAELRTIAGNTAPYLR